MSKFVTSVAIKVYLDVLKRSLIGMLEEDASGIVFLKRGSSGVEDAEVRPMPYRKDLRLRGQDWPVKALTMIGWKRMSNLQYCMTQVLADNIPGDVIETGVWRGGATIFMRGMLKAYGITDRKVWVADSFRGFPVSTSPHDPQGPSPKWLRDCLAVPAHEVRKNFQRYNLLDKQVRFLEGWFRDTLPKAPIKKLAILRLDGDYYESTMHALQALYDKLSSGGFVIIDDYNIPACRKAVLSFRQARGITKKIQEIDGLGVFWRKP